MLLREMFENNENILLKFVKKYKFIITEKILFLITVKISDNGFPFTITSTVQQ